MIHGQLRRAHWWTLVQALLLLIPLYSLVFDLGTLVRGAKIGSFLPVAILAVLLGWGLSQERFKDWQVFAFLGLLGCVLLWARTAQFGGPLLTMVTSMPAYLLQIYFHKYGAPAPDSLAMRTAVVDMAIHSTGVWVRVRAWLTGLGAGANLNDPVIHILMWSLLLWMLVAWAAWASRRNRILAGLVPVLAVMAAITQYTGTNMVAMWLMAGSLLAMLGISRFTTNLRRWDTNGLDYAEIIIPNTMISLVIICMGLVTLGWVLPQFSVKDFLDSFRPRQTANNQTTSALGLDRARAPGSTSPFAPLRSSDLPNKHLLGSGQELSREVVFTVETGELSPMPDMHLQVAPRHYWRSNTFDVYTGVGWLSTQMQEIKYPAGQALYDAPPGYRLLTQKFNMENGNAGSLIWTGNLYRSDTPFEAAWRTPPGQDSPQAVDPFRGADLVGALNTSPVYQVESLIPQVSVEKLLAAGRDYPDFIRKRYTVLPSYVPDRVYALARKVTSSAATPFDEARAIETYLRETYPYSLKITKPPANSEVVDYFLFDLKTGYCDYYATAMAVMARSIGLPARLVMGYANGTYSYSSAKYIVTAADAHSWVEIYFPGTGWVEFEPTAGQPELIRLVQGGDPPSAQTYPVQQWNKFLRSVARWPSATRWVLFPLACVSGLVILFFLLEGWLLGLVSPAFALRWMIRSVYRQGRYLAGAPVPGQTASEFAENLQTALKKPDPRLDVLTNAYLQSLFSPHPPKKVEVQQAIRAWRGLRWKLLWARWVKREK